MQYFDNNENLKSELRTLNYTYENNHFTFYSDLGVFSKDKIDLGSRLLVETYFKYGKKSIKVLDVGCGYGFIGITLNKVMDANVDMIDINDRAMHLAKMNQKENKAVVNIFKSNIYENITEKYDCIISNPPIRAGKSVYLTIINGAPKYLNSSGELWFVMRTNHGVKTVIKNLKEKYPVEVLKKDMGYYIVKVICAWNIMRFYYLHLELLLLSWYTLNGD